MLTSEQFSSMFEWWLLLGDSLFERYVNICVVCDCVSVAQLRVFELVEFLSFTNSEGGLLCASHRYPNLSR